MIEVLEYIIFQHFGAIILTLVIVAVAIKALRALDRFNRSILQSQMAQCKAPTVTPTITSENLAVLNLEPTSKTLTPQQFEEQFGVPMGLESQSFMEKHQTHIPSNKGETKAPKEQKPSLLAVARGEPLYETLKKRAGAKS